MKKLLFISHPQGAEDKEPFYQALKKKYECLFWKHETKLMGGRNFDVLDLENIGDLDIVYIHAGSISDAVLESIKRNCNNPIAVQWSGDCRDELFHDTLRLKGLVDITLLACGMGEQKKMYEKELGRVEWFPHGVTDWQFLPVNKDAKGIIFIGNNYEHFSGARDRAEICKQLKETYGDLFKVYGNGWGDIGEGTIPFEENHLYYNKAAIGIDGSIFNDKDGYFSHRPLQIMAAGCLCMVRRFPQYEKSFHPRSFCTWDNADELIKTIDSFLGDKELRNYYAETNQISMKKRFHYDALVERFENILNAKVTA